MKFRTLLIELQVCRANFAVFAETKALDRAVFNSEQWSDVRVITIGEQKAVSRDDVDEPFKRKLDGREIFENVGMIKFEIVDDDEFREVMNELAPLVEKSGVVFVAFDDEPIAIREASALAEIIRNAADQVTRVPFVVLEDPGKKRSGCGLPMSTGNYERFSAANEKFLEQFRERTITKLLLQHCFRFGVAARNSISDHNEVRPIPQITFLVTGHEFDSPLLQECGHGRINILIRAADLKTAFLNGGGGRSHGSAANTNEMNRFNLTEHG